MSVIEGGLRCWEKLPGSTRNWQFDSSAGTRMYARGLLLMAVLAAAPQQAVFAQLLSASDQYQVAAEHYKNRRWSLATEEFETFLEDHESHRLAPSARFFLGESKLQSDDKVGALLEYEAYLRSGDLSYQAVAEFRAGETAYLLDQPKQATQHLERYIQEYPTDNMSGYALTYLGNLALDADEAKSAQEYFGEALRRFANQPFADSCRFGIAKAYLKLKRYDDAERFFTFLIDSRKFGESSRLQLAVIQLETDQQKAASDLRNLRAITNDPAIASQAGYWLGVLSYRAGEWSEAARLLSSADLDATLAPSAAFTAADALQRLDDMQGAKQQLHKIIANWPGSRWGDDALQSLIAIADQQNQVEELDRLLQEFGRRFPKSPLRSEVSRTHGRSLLQQDRLEEAATAFESIQVANRTASDWYHIGLTRLAQRQFESALVALDRVDHSNQTSTLRSATVLARATALVRLERFQQATPVLQEYLALHPSGDDANRCRAQLAVALASQQKWDEVRPIYEALSAAEPSGAEFWSTTHFLADAAAARNDDDLARQLYRKMADKAPSKELQAAGLGGLAWLNIDSDGDGDDALQRLLNDHADHPLAARAALARARALLSGRRTNEAIAAYQILIRRFPKASQLPAALLELAQVLDQMDRDEEAKEALRRLLNDHPEFAKIATAHYLLAWVLNDLGETVESANQFRRIVDRFPTSHLWADSAYRLAEQAAKANRLEEAESIAKSITDRNLTLKASAHAWYLRGQVAAKQRQWAAVESHMKQVLDSSHSNDLYLSARYWVAESLYRRRKYQQAGEQFEALSQLAAGRQDEWLGMLPLRRAQVLAHQKRWREAFDAAQSVREQHPGFRQMHEVDYLLGRCQGSWADFADARDSYRRVIQSPSGRGTETAAMAQWMIGETYFLQNNYPDAIRAYHRVVRFPKWQAAALLQAAKSHIALDQPEPAAKLIDQMLRDFPDSEFAAEARTRRDKLARQLATP